MTDFVTLDQFDSYMRVEDDSDDVDAELRALALEAAHIGVREAIGRDLTLIDDDTEPTVRTFKTSSAGLGRVLRIDDCTDVTEIAGVALNTAIHRLEPLNNRASSGQWRPYTQIRSQWFWATQRFGNNFGYVDITAPWGWSQIPRQAYSAVLALAKDIEMNKDVAFGLAQITDYAGIRARENPEVWRQIKGLQRAERMLIR